MLGHRKHKNSLLSVGGGVCVLNVSEVSPGCLDGTSSCLTVSLRHANEPSQKGVTSVSFIFSSLTTDLTVFFVFFLHTAFQS